MDKADTYNLTILLAEDDKGHAALVKKIPVIMLTTTDNPGEIDLCYEMGCFSYIVKPSDYNKFMEALEHLGAFLSLPNLVVPTISSPDSIVA